MSVAVSNLIGIENSRKSTRSTDNSVIPEELRNTRKENQKGDLDSGDESGLRGRVISPVGLECQHVFSANLHKTWLDFLKKPRFHGFTVFTITNKGSFCRCPFKPGSLRGCSTSGPPAVTRNLSANSTSRSNFHLFMPSHRSNSDTLPSRLNPETHPPGKQTREAKALTLASPLSRSIFKHQTHSAAANFRGL